MDSRPIGVFDSGLGGLTAVKELVSILPGEDIVYLGDTGRVPYGPRSREIIIKYTGQAIAFLRGQNVKRIIVACGTSSTVLGAVPEASEKVTGVVVPAAHAAVGATKNKKIGIIGTVATVRSGAYETVIKKSLPEAEIVAMPCPLLVPVVEAGRIQRGDIVAETLVAEYLEPVKRAGVDTLIMGCTHYPLLKDVIAAFLGEGTRLIDPGAEAAKAVKLMQEADGSCSTKSMGKISYFVTDSTESFCETAELFLKMPVRGSVCKIDIERG